ncbi:hypothetical protein G7054_g9268 [Neopestalotiopsis clavispora]|nr:hypothetical protein G7054_g9268 [Neopestalotiopsis clavispora]
MNRDHNGRLHTGTWSNESSLSSTPEPFEFGINHEASGVWECGDFAGLSAPPFFLFNVNQQYVTGTNLQQQQPHIQPFNGLPHGGNPVVNIRPSVFHPSFLSVPDSSSLKRPHSFISTTAYRQEAAPASPNGSSLYIFRGRPQSSQSVQHHLPLEKRRRFVQTPNSGIRHDALSRDQKPEVTVKKDDEGKARGQLHVFGKHEKVRRGLTADETARTKKTRELSACGRCKALKQRCDRPTCDLMPCGNCLKARGSVKARPGDALCIRVKLLDLNLHRNGSTDTSLLEARISLQSTRACNTFYTSDLDRRTIQLSQGIDGIVLTVPVAQYQVKGQDKTWYLWKDSDKKVQRMNMPAYHICDMQSARGSLLQQFGSGSTSKYVLSLLKDEDIVIKEAFCEAHRLSHHSSLLRDSLNIWCGTRFTELTWTICGNDKLGILPPTESDNPWKGTVPVTPIMDTQLDEIAINSFMKPYSAHLLQELHHKMTNQDTTDWYEVLLSLIIILHNFQWMSKDIKEYTVRHGMEKTSFPGRPSLSHRNIFACKSLLAYFHFAYLGSRRLFSFMRNGEETESIPEKQQKFLHLLRRFMNKKDQLKDWRRRDMYKDSMFWIIQLLVFDWRADFEPTTPIDDFTEEDLLTT